MDYAKLQDERDAMMEQRDKLADALREYMVAATRGLIEGRTQETIERLDKALARANEALAEVG